MANAFWFTYIFPFIIFFPEFPVSSTIEGGQGMTASSFNPRDVHIAVPPALRLTDSPVRCVPGMSHAQGPSLHRTYHVGSSSQLEHGSLIPGVVDIGCTSAEAGDESYRRNVKTRISSPQRVEINVNVTVRSVKDEK